MSREAEKNKLCLLCFLDPRSKDWGRGHSLKQKIGGSNREILGFSRTTIS